MRNSFKSIVLSGLLVLTTSHISVAYGAKGEANSTVEIPAQSAPTFPQPIKRSRPQYPVKAANDGIEGWVLVEFSIETDGSISEIVVLDSSPAGVFEKSATRAVRRWKYPPVERDGKIVKIRTQVVLTFELEGSGGTSKGFKVAFKRAERALNLGELTTALKIIEELETDFVRNSTELAFFEYLHSRYYLATKDYHLAMVKLRRAGQGDWKYFNKSKKIELLRLLFSLEANEHQYISALETFDQLKTTEKLKEEDPLREKYEVIVAILKGNAPIAVPGFLTETCYECGENQFQMRYKLARKSFYIDEVEGEIEALRLSCGNYWADFEFDPELTWTIGAKWGQCELTIKGLSQTHFRLVEM